MSERLHRVIDRSVSLAKRGGNAVAEFLKDKRTRASLGALACAAALTACTGLQSDKQVGEGDRVTDHLPTSSSATATTAAPETTTEAPTSTTATTAAETTTAATTTAAATTTTAPRTTTQAPVQTPTPPPSPTTHAPAPQTNLFTINCGADPAACIPSGLPAYNYPGRGPNGEVYALNAISGNGNANAEGVRQPASGQVEGICEGTAPDGSQWVEVKTDSSWAQSQGSGQGSLDEAYVERGALTGGAVGKCNGTDFTEALR